MTTWAIDNGLVGVGITAEGGHLGPVAFHTGLGTIEPMHDAPWRHEDTVDDELPPMLRTLRGDFFCAPFGDSDVLLDESRPHGAPANDLWRLEQRRDHALTLRLEPTILGATLHKHVTLRPDHPVVYQEHVFEGGSGSLPMGHHAMLRLPRPSRLAFSPRIWMGTPPDPIETPPRGRSLLLYPQRFDDLRSAWLADGERVDLATYPQLEAHEEIVLLASDPADAYAWSAVTSPDGWVWFGVRANDVLRSTVLWMSHGGRHYAPWSSRHTHVIGIEEVTAAFHLGHRASIAPNSLRAAGVDTAVDLRPEGAVRTRYAFGLVPTPSGFGCVARLTVLEDALHLEDEDGATLRVPFDGSFLA
jgi:hypothetical protein